MSKIVSTIVDMIAQRKGYVVLTEPKFVPRRQFGAKSSSPLERLATMKSDKVDSTAKMVPRPILLATEIGSPAEKDETNRVSSC
ncbi:hypothetical protein TB2_031679 [Malus domestica]